MKHKTNNKKKVSTRIKPEASLKRDKFDHRSLPPPCDRVQE